MVWRDHVFNYGPKLAARVTKFQEKKLAGRDSFFRNFVTLGADFEAHD